MVDNQTSLDFNKPGYSYETSLPAYEEGRHTVKARQQETILEMIKSSGANTIREIAKLTGLPDSTIAGRLNDLIKSGKVEYKGFVEYDGRKRKEIGLV
jgi:DNA-binding IclR family transcriptional regulator